MDENLLFNAAYGNDADAIRKAVSAGHDPNKPHPRAGHTPLQAACELNALAAISVLLEMGANAGQRFTRVSRVDGRVAKDRVPLMYVKSLDAAQLLLDAGADVNARDAEGWSPLAWAINAGSLELFEYLIDKGADPRITVGLSATRGTLIDLIDEKLARLHFVLDGRAVPDLLATISRLEALRLRLIGMGISSAASVG